MSLCPGRLQPCAAVGAAGCRRQAPLVRSTAVLQQRSVALRQRDSGLAALQSRCRPSLAASPRPVAGHLQCRAAAAAEGQGFSDGDADSSAAAEKKEPLGKTLYLGALFGGWYLFNIWFNIYNKKALKVFPYPMTCTAIQFGVGSLMVLVMWTLGLHKKPKLEQDTLKNISPLALVHALGNTLTNVSLGRVAVSFTHTIKAMEPFFSVLLSWIFLGEAASAPVLLSLLPIVGGVAAASVSEVTFNWGGFAAAMGSNLSFQSRNVLSKKLMIGAKSLDNINLFSVITIMAFLVLAPIAIAIDGVQFTPAAMRAAGIADPGTVMKHVLIAAACFHSYQQVSYMILQRVSPVTHSIGNCLKRVIVIVASVIVFQNPMSRQNMIGTGVALAGVFAYSQVKRLSGKKKAA